MLAKSKLNSIETLMSQALIDLEVTHEEFKTIVNEKQKYVQTKESIRNIKSSDELSEKSRDIRKVLKIHKFEKNNFFFFVYKMVDISVENYKNSAVYMTPIPNEEFW